MDLVVVAVPTGCTRSLKGALVPLVKSGTVHFHYVTKRTFG
jgi:hypothetical protein